MCGYMCTEYTTTDHDVLSDDIKSSDIELHFVRECFSCYRRHIIYHCNPESVNNNAFVFPVLIC